MKTSRLFSLAGALALFLTLNSNAQSNQIQISELNTYENLSEITQEALQSHPLVGVEVAFTAVIISNPKSSGLATSNDTDSDGVIDSISRIHVFVTDTSATNSGRDGMSIQIVESDYEMMQDFERGDVVDFVGTLGFFNSSAQVDLSSANLIGNVRAEFPQHAHLLEPWEVELSELNILNGDGTHEVNTNFYSKYNASYVQVNNGLVKNVVDGSRPDFALESAGGRIYLFDTSLRYRNDRTDNYLPGYNYRRSSEGDFTPPVPGSIVNLSGFVQIASNDPDGNQSPDKQAFSINPFEDGVLWDGDQKFVNGQDLGEGKTFEWPNDLVIVSEPTGNEVTVTFNVNTSTLTDTLQEYHTLQLRGGVFGPDNENTGLANFITWNSNTLRLSNEGGDYWTISFDMSPGDSLEYKFWAGTDQQNPMVNGDEQGWESGFNRIFKLPENTVSDTTLALHWFETKTPPFETDTDSISVYFRVNVGPFASVGAFDPLTDVVGVRGTPPFFRNEVDWSNTKLVLEEESPRNGNNLFFTGSLKFHPDDRPLFDDTRYKFVIEKANDGVLFEATNERVLIIPQADTTLHWVFFGDDDFNSVVPVLPIPEPPYEIGEIINYNGSFALNELGTASEGRQGWFFETVNGPSTYEIVADAQDGDGKAAKATISFDGTVDLWRAQMVNEPINVVAGELYKITFWLKSSADMMNAQAFIGLPQGGNFREMYTYNAALQTEWTMYEFNYFANAEAEDLGLRFGVKMNMPENDGQMIYLDNVRITKVEAQITTVNFSVNMAVQEDLENFDPTIHTVKLLGGFNGWNAGAQEVMITSDDSIYTYSFDFLNISLNDTIRYKFIMMDENTGVFQWESPDPENPRTIGEFNDRFVVIDDLELVEADTPYFHDIDRADTNADNYGITPISDARVTPLGTHLAIQGIVTRITNNFVYVDDGTAATTLFSRSWFSDINSIGFNMATKAGDIQKGDVVKIAGITGDFNGLHQLVNIHSWDVVSSGNPLPQPQIVTLDEYSVNGEAYESEVVRVERVRLLDPVDSLMGGYIYEIINEAETEIGLMSIQGSNNSDWAWKPAPQGYFNIEAVVKEFYIPQFEGNIYAVAIHDEGDIEEIGPNFDATFDIDSFASLPGNIETLDIHLLQIGAEPIQGMEFTINFDATLVDVNLGNQTGTSLEGTSIISNKLDGQLLVAFATDGTPENDISEIGRLLNLKVSTLAEGLAEIVVSDILINEKPSPDLVSYVNIVPRLCGDVTGDATISAEDATLVLQHTVELDGVYPLLDLDAEAADVTGNGDISAFDASWILQKTVGIRDNLGCISLPLKKDLEPVVAKWFLADNDGGNSVVQLDISQNEMEIFALQMELELTAGVQFRAFKNLPDNWNMITNTSDNKTMISLYGVIPIELKTLELEFNTDQAQAVSKVKADLVLNEQAVPELDDLVLGGVPSEFGLNQNYPNPFNPSTNISYTVAEKADLQLSIFNMLGQKVATIVNQSQDAGSYTVSWQAGSMSSGVYIYRLTAGGNTFTKRMMLIK